MDLPTVQGSSHGDAVSQVDQSRWWGEAHLNKKSVGVSAGTKHVRYTVNSSGRRTTSVGAPGTGMSWRQTSSSSSPRTAQRGTRAVAAVPAAVITGLVIWDLFGTLPLPLGVAGHEGSTVIVGLNGLRLLRATAWRNAGQPRSATARSLPMSTLREN